ncbi:MAG: MarC family protein [bacterium]
MLHWTEYTRIITTLLAVVDPFLAIPVFLSITRDYTERERRKTAIVVTFTVTVVLLCTALTGETILRWIGTSLASFMVGGGIVLLLMALSMLHATAGHVRQTPEEEMEMAEKSAAAIVPLGIPLLAGPGAISTVIIAMHRGSSWNHYLIVLCAIVIVCLVLWLMLHLALPIGTAMGTLGLNIANRILGLLLAAFSIEIIANGLKQLFPILSKLP